MTLDQKVSINPCVGIVYNERYSLRIMLKIKGTQITIHPSIHRFQNAFLRCPTPRLLCFLSSHWPSLKFLSFMAFLMPSIQLFFGLPRAVFCFGIHFNAIFGNLPSTILWTWPYHVSWFCSISFIIVSCSLICCLIVCAILWGKLWEMTGHDCFRIRIVWAKMEFTNKQTLSNAWNVYFSRQEV